MEHDSAAAVAAAGEKEERDGDGGDGDGALRATDKVLCPSHACFTHGAQFNTHGSVHAPFAFSRYWFMDRTGEARLFRLCKKDSDDGDDDGDVH